MNAPVQAAPAGWTDVLNDLLLGVTHQISNRVATLAGVSDILAGDESVPPILRALTGEVPRLESAIRLLRLLAVPPGETDEALEVPRLLDEAIPLAQLHPECRDVEFRAPSDRDVPPVMAPPTRLTHELVVALVVAGVHAGAHAEAPVTVRYRTEGGDLLVGIGDRVVRARTLAALRTDQGAEREGASSSS